jgi:cysteinyl-tRNA synthetase
MDLTWSALEIADAQLGKWRRKTALWGTSTELKVDPEFLEAIENDLDTPRALQRLRLIEKSQEISDSDKRAFFIYADKTLGLDLTRAVLMRDISKEQQDMLNERSVARSEKRWADSDALRLALENTGLAIKDGASGQEWSWR